MNFEKLPDCQLKSKGYLALLISPKLLGVLIRFLEEDERL